MTTRTHAGAKLEFSRSLLAVAVSSAVSSPALAQQETSLEEIIVTARKRSENLQDIPQAIQAISALQIEQAGIRRIDDYARFIPSLSFVTYGPGTSKVVCRGVADSAVSFIADASAAVYLDEQPLTQNSQNPEPRLIDIERIEVLTGPQGTLYGASSQSCTVRIITQKPDPNEFQAELGSSVYAGPESETSYEITGVVNLPIKQDTVGLRLVGFDARDGGFIDNVLGTSPGGGFDNASVVREDFNRADYRGGRITALWNAGEDWQITTGAIYQDTSSNSEQGYEANVGDLEVVRFHEEPREDTWSQYHFTVEGDLGFADLVSSSSYFERDISYVYDSTAYNFYLRTLTYPYYLNYDFGPDPSGFAFQFQDTRRFAQELRLSHEGERVQWIAGLFYERFDDHWDYNVRIEDYESTGSFAYWDALYYDVGPGTTGGVSYNSNNKTIVTQYALFGEVNIDFAERWTLTTGGRLFDTERDRTYFQEIPNNHVAVLDNPIASLRDFTPKVSLRYRIDDERMVYALYSQGFRNGGANILRARSDLPRTYEPDFLDNYEVGLKSRWAGGRVQVNATAYRMLWKDYQVELEDPDPTVFAVGVANIGNAQIDGLEIELQIAASERLDVGSNLIFLRSEATSDDPLTGVRDGARLPNTSEFKASAYLQYNWPVPRLAGEGYVRLQYSYTGESFNDVACDPVFAEENGSSCTPPLPQAAYQISDAALGIGGTTWDLAFYVDNIFDERAQIFRPFAIQPIDRPPGYCDGNLCDVTVNRPTEYGLSFSKRWGD
jgi:outer membrane receptor protein involved in Fe transport